MPNTTQPTRKPADLKLVPVGPSFLVRDIDALGVITPDRQGSAKGWRAKRLGQDLGFYSVQADAVAAVKRADNVALPDVPLTQRQLRAVLRASNRETKRK